MDTFNYWFLITLAAVFVGMGKGGLPVIATLGVPTLSLIMSPITAAVYYYPYTLFLIFSHFRLIDEILIGKYLE